MLCLLRKRCLPTSLKRFYSTTKPKPTGEDIVQQLANKADQYRQELRKHLFSSPTHRTYTKSINTIKNSLGVLEIRRKQLESILDMNLKPDIVSLEILSNGTTHLRPVVIIRTPFDIYLFNCPEGTSRFLPSLRVSPQTIKNFFITRDTWDCFGGLFGVLLAKENTDHKTHLHGPSNMKYFLECVRPFADSDFSSVQQQPFQMEEHTHQDEKYEDITLTAYYLSMFIMNNEADSSAKACDFAYLVELKEPNKRIDMLKCRAKNVPKGPMIGELKAGNKVSLEDGTEVFPEEVYAEHMKDSCPNILIVDCDNIEKLDSLATNGRLKEYTDGKKQMGTIVHLTSEAILKDEKYKKWMDSFGKACLNLVVNGSGEALPITEGIYKQQRMLNEVCSDLFPDVFPFGFKGNVTQDVEVPSTNFVEAKPLEKYIMRTTKAAKGNDAVGIFLDKSELKEREMEDPSLSDAISEFKEKAKSLEVSGSKYPIVSFLGTGSAVPSKYRNVSAHLLELNDKTSVLIDCGEGTYGQLKVLHGPEKIDDTLIGLSAIFVTHAHLDHIGGIMTIVKRRQEAFQSKELKYRPLILACNYNVRKMLTMYRTNFHDLDQYLNYVEIGLYVSNVADFTDYSSEDLVSHVTKLLPEELYSSESWNLKAVRAVQVHHTRMANGFIFDTECGKRVVFSGDTMPCDLLAEVGKDADLLIHEATFEDGFENDARRKKHSTTGQAIEIAQKMNAKLLILSHFSARYPRMSYISELMLRAGNVGVAFDNMVVRFNQHRLLPMLLPVYVKLFRKELDELSVKEMQRNLKSTTNDGDQDIGQRKTMKKELMRRSKSPNFSKKPRHSLEPSNFETPDL